MKCLVTGGTGFIGSHLCRRLLDEGNRVVCIDDLSSSSLDNVSSFAHRMDFRQMDIVDGIPDEKFDIVFHLACPASPSVYQRDHVKTITTAFNGTLSVLKLAHSGSRIVIASTSEIYGDPLVHPQREDYFGNVNPTGPRSCYDEGKRAAEALCWSWRYMYGSDIRVARLFNVYGPGMNENDGRMIPNFITQAMRGDPLTVYGDGTQTRSLCYVDDLIDFLMKYASSNYSYSGFSVMNVGNPDERRVIDIADFVRDRWKSMTNIELEIKHLSSLPDDPSRRMPDISLAQDGLDWQPKITFEDGMHRTMDWFMDTKK